MKRPCSVDLLWIRVAISNIDLFRLKDVALHTGSDEI